MERVCSSAEVFLCIGILDNDSALLPTGTQCQDILQTRTKSCHHYISPGGKREHCKAAEQKIHALFFYRSYKIAILYWRKLLTCKNLYTIHFVISYTIKYVQFNLLSFLDVLTRLYDGIAE